MKRIVLALAVALAAPLAATHPAEVEAAGPTADEIGARVQSFYDSTKTFSSKFTQTYTIKVQNVKKVSTGKVTFEKPGKMSWRYDAPGQGESQRLPNRLRVFAGRSTIQAPRTFNKNRTVTSPMPTTAKPRTVYSTAGYRSLHGFSWPGGGR